MLGVDRSKGKGPKKEKKKNANHEKTGVHERNGARAKTTQRMFKMP